VMVDTTTAFIVVIVVGGVLVTAGYLMFRR
jgi:hypothetical protein